MKNYSKLSSKDRFPLNKKAKIDLHICHSPLTHMISEFLIQRSNGEAIILSSYNSQIAKRIHDKKKSKLIFLDRNGKNTEGFLHNLRCLRNIKKYKFENIYSSGIPHSCHFPSLYILSKLNFKKINYIDEGFLMTSYFSKFFHGNKRENIKEKLKFHMKNLVISTILLTKPILSWDLSKKNIGNLYYFNVGKMGFKKYNNKFIDLGEVIGGKGAVWDNICEKFCEKMGLKLKKVEILYVSQNIKEDGYGLDEVKLFERFILKKCKNKKVYVKLHYREDKEKYNALIEKYDNIYLLDIDKKVPFEAVYSQLQPKIMAGFFSTCLFSMPLKNTKKIYLLSKMEKGYGDYNDIIDELIKKDGKYERI